MSGSAAAAGGRAVENRPGSKAQQRLLRAVYRPVYPAPTIDGNGVPVSRPGDLGQPAFSFPGERAAVGLAQIRISLGIGLRLKFEAMLRQ